MKACHGVSALVVLAILLAGARPAQSQAQSSGAPGNASLAAPPTVDRTEELEARVKALEDRYQQSAGFRDTDYILRIQKQYEAYYEKAFSTQVTVVWAVGLIFTAILALAGRFSFGMFEKRIEYATSTATDELKRTFEHSLASELAELEKGNREHTAKAIEDLKEITDKAINNILQRVKFDLQISQGLTFSHAGRHKEARLHYHSALDIYLKDKTAYVKQNDCAITISNIFRSLYKEDQASFEENGKQEVQETRYRDLQEELRLAAGFFANLGPLLPRPDADPQQE